MVLIKFHQNLSEVVMIRRMILKIKVETITLLQKKKNSILNFFQLVTTDSRTDKTDSNEDKNHMEPNTDHCDDSNVIDLCDSDSNVDEQNNSTLKETEMEATSAAPEKENVANVDNSTLSQDTEIKKNTLKIPRRIPLITLGSPKRKKKE
uniref:Uncharacterized protein n=1 Tax=Photinus pyralis TaxID=7054 RepID=A0A1Y1LTL8_PHOPY